MGVWLTFDWVMPSLFSTFVAGVGERVQVNKKKQICQILLMVFMLRHEHLFPPAAGSEALEKTDYVRTGRNNYIRFVQIKVVYICVRY